MFTSPTKRPPYLTSVPNLAAARTAFLAGALLGQASHPQVPLTSSSSRSRALCLSSERLSWRSDEDNDEVNTYVLVAASGSRLASTSAWIYLPVSACCPDLAPRQPSSSAVYSETS